MSTLSNLLSDFFRTPERGVFWDHDKRANVDPLEGLTNGFWDAIWDLKLKILRQLVEYQLTHSTQIKDTLDRAWGVKAMSHKKKDQAESAPPPDDDPLSQKSLMQQPIGQDTSRKRYWVLDSSPRLYVSTNPWKITQTFAAASSTREEYVQAIEKLKVDGPPQGPLVNGAKRTKLENGHLHLIQELEARLEAIDAELARIERARKKIEQRNLLLAQAEIRGPRTRRQTNRPDYLDPEEVSDGDDHDEYKYEDDEMQDDEERWSGDERYPSRRSTRRAQKGAEVRRSSRQQNGKRKSEEQLDWRIERRSRRLGGLGDADFDNPRDRKRSRTVESSEAESSTANSNHTNGAGGLKASEVAVEAIKGKKKNRFWYYAVEPAPAAPSGVNSEMADERHENASSGIKSSLSRRVPSSTPSDSVHNSEHTGSVALEASAPMSLDSEMEED